MIVDSTEFFRRKREGINRDSGNESDRDLRLKVREIRRQVEEVMGLVRTQSFAEALRSLAENSDDIQEAAIAWVELIELLVQDREMARGRRSGQGRLKKKEVKQVARYLLRAEEFDIPFVPSYLEPVIIDVVVDVTIDAVVVIVNDNDLWFEEDRELSLFRRFWAGSFRLLFEPVFSIFGQLFGWVWDKLHPVYLPPRLQPAVDRVIEEGCDCTLKDALTGLTDAKIFIGENSDGVQAFVRLVTESVKQAEFFLARDVSGSEKKDYARRLIMAVLDDLDLSPQSDFLRGLVDFAVGVAIEIAVDLFNKRNVFISRSR